MVVEKRNNGISLISLIITIIVIIILAAIVIFSGMDTPEKAQLSKVISDIDNVQTAVDQAYYGLYTEKAVAGEVWTPSQFYEAVATGEKNRDNLNGTGLIEISENGLVDINLPVYEGRTWYIAVSNMSDTIKIGSAVLSPGFESQGKTYATLLDIQNGGGNGSGVNEGNQGGLTEEDKKLLAQIKVGDYVTYIPESGECSTDVDNTGYSVVQELKTETTTWRVLHINDENGEIRLTTSGVVNEGTYLKGAKGYVRGPKELNRICEILYSNKSLAITARNMTIDDLNLACNYYELSGTDKCYAYYPNGTLNLTGYEEYMGKEYTRIAHSNSDARFYSCDLGGETVNGDIQYVKPTSDKPVFISQKYYNYIPNSKNSIVGDILGNKKGWLATQCVLPAGSFTYFSIETARSGAIGTINLSNSANPNYGSQDAGLRPLISLNIKRLEISSAYSETENNIWKIK